MQSPLLIYENPDCGCDRKPTDFSVASTCRMHRSFWASCEERAAARATQHMIGIGTALAGWMGDECSDPGKPLVPERFQGQPEYVTDRKAERE